MKWEMEVLSPVSYPSNMNSWFMEESKYTKWTPAENKMFENALAEHDKDTPDRWHKVAAMIPGKTVGDVMRHYRELEVDVSKIEAGLIPISGYGNGCSTSPFTLEWDNGYGGHDGFRYGIGGKRSSSARPPEQERKKGVPWTEEEHKLFLMGLKKYGKGDWRNISRNFVITRTPTQVASHAQKYFIRQLSGGKDKRRASIHDITTVNLNETTRTPSPDNKRPSSPSSQDACSTVLIQQQTPASLNRTTPFLWNQHSNGSTTMTFNATPHANMFMSSAYGANNYGLKVQGQQNLHLGPAGHGTFVGHQNLDFPLQSMHRYSDG